jgi:uncharacterized membrane protein YfcA
VAQLALSLRRPALPGGTPPPWPVGVGAGFVMGVASMVAHSGGVVLNLYLLALRLPTTTILATGNALIVFTNAVKLLGYWRVGFLTGSIVLAAVLVTRCWRWAPGSACASGAACPGGRSSSP